MTNYKKGKKYENFVECVYKAILEAEKREGKTIPISIERNKTISSNNGTSAEIDIYWEFEIGGFKNSVAIECRNYNRNVDIPQVRDFADKISNISGLKGVMVTKKGFSKEAIARAKSSNIDLIVLREHQAQDWDGYLRGVNVRIHILHPSQSLNFTTHVNKEWATKSSYQPDSNKVSVRNDLLILEDRESGFKHSLKEMEENDFYENKGAGHHAWEREFKDGWVHHGEESIKVDRIRIEYLKPDVTEDEFSIDFEQYVLAVIEYIHGKEGKFVVLKSGQQKSY